MSTVNALYHIIINTHRRQMTIPENCCDDLYRYIWGIIKNHNCVLYRIGGIQNHIHMLIQIHPDVNLSSLVRDIKASSSKWAKGNPSFPNFVGWGKEYGAFTCSYNDKDRLISYIKGQRVHHKVQSFEEEFKSIIIESGNNWNDNKLT